MRPSPRGSTCGWSIGSRARDGTADTSDERAAVTRAARRVRAAWLGIAIAGGAPLAAQRRPVLEVELPAPSQLAVQGPLVRAREMLSGPRILEPLAAGFPARFHFAIELWSEGMLFSRSERRAEYDVIVRHIALENVYEVSRIEVDRPPLALGKFARVDDAESQIGKWSRVGIVAPHSPRRMYYLATLTVQIIDLSDLDELNRWLKGELQPAISGDRNPGTVVSRGLRSFAARLLGGETREYEQKTATFRVP